jgi:uncharacterized protein (DUF58 family)
MSSVSARVPARGLPQLQLKGRFGHWIDRRIPPSPRITLSQRSIFIFPTVTGFVFGGLVVLLVLGAINYQSSLVYAVAFLLGSLFLVTILYTFRNLSGITIELTGAGAGFVGENMEFAVRISRPHGAGREGIQIGWLGTIAQWVELSDVEASVVKLFVPTERRGWLDPGRLLIETQFPLGLLRAWTWVDLDARALVYPRPIFQDPPRERSRPNDEGELVDPQGSDDFHDIGRYRPGDRVRHILWRTYARSGELAVKRYASYLDPRFILDWESVRGDSEERLSRLTGMALQAARIDREYGLRLPGVDIAPSAGEKHLERCLRALALHGLDEAR